MDFFTAFDISATGLTAQRTRMNVISSNLANVHSTESENGQPYRRKDVVVTATPMASEFNTVLQEKINAVQVTEIIEDQRPFRTVYEPYHPSADKNGFVHYPNVTVIEEMVNMLSASRTYEANVNVLKASKSMALKALDIGK